MALPAAFLGGAAVGALAGGIYKLIQGNPSKEELERKQMDADTLFVVQPKTPLQRTATNVVNSLFF